MQYKTKEKFEIPVKRFYIPVEIKEKCPKCKTICSVNLDDNYLSYPSVNHKEVLEVYCDKCDDEFTICITLELEIKVEN